MPAIPSGRALLDSEKILKETGLEAGMTYADFGAGAIGHFVFPAADIVGEDGVVYAVDILKSAIAALKSRLKLVRPNNIKTVWGDVERINGARIPDGSCDFVSLVNIAGLVKSSPTVLEEAKRVLKEGGKLLLVGWRPGVSNFGPPQEKRITSKEAQSIVIKAGYEHIESFEAGPHHWGIIFQAP